MNNKMKLCSKSKREMIWLISIFRSKTMLFMMISFATFFAAQGQPDYHQVRHPPEFQQSRCNEVKFDRCKNDFEEIKWEFTCKDGNCIARYDQCDGIDQCPDGSDEEECHRYEQHHNPNGHPTREDSNDGQGKKDSRVQGENQQHQQRPPNTNTAPKVMAAKEPKKHSPPMQMLLIGASVFVIVAIVVHVAMKVKRRKRNICREIGVRGFRNGESLIDDEDDLLISQAYN